MSKASKTLLSVALVTIFGVGLAAQGAPQQPTPARTPPATAGPPPLGTTVTVPTDYVIGPEDVIGVLFWREMDMSGDVTVRPDGMVTLPLLGDVKAAGLRPEALGAVLEKVAGKYLSDAKATVVVRQINSRKVFITGEVRTPGAYPVVGPRTVLQLIALAGGLSEYADNEKITIMRNESNGTTTRTFKFNYKEVSKGKRLEQNILLQPGDTVLVP